MNVLNKEEIICKKILNNMFLRDCFLSGIPWKYFGYSIPLHVFDSSLQGDIDLLVRLVHPLLESEEDVKDVIRAIEVKVFSINNEVVKPTRVKQGKKTQQQIKKLKDLGFNWVYLLDVFVLSNITDPIEHNTCLRVLKERHKIANEKKLGYLFFLCDEDLNLTVPRFVHENYFQPLVNVGTEYLQGDSIEENSIADNIIKHLDSVNNDMKPGIADVITFSRNKKCFVYEKKDLGNGMLYYQL